MEDGLKQRLVGAVVLVLLAVIFIPMLLDSGSDPGEAVSGLDPSSGGESESFSRILPAGESPDGGEGESAEREAKLSGGNERVAGTGESARSVSAAPEATGGADASAAAPQAGASVAAGEPEEAFPSPGWAARIGSFTDRRNALVLRNRLRAKGYAAFTETAGSGQDRVTRVLVGPEPTRERTISVMEEFRRDTGLDGFLVRYQRN